MVSSYLSGLGCVLSLMMRPLPVLRIHEDIERGDNDTVKLGNKTVKIDGKKCTDL
jgi:hypothetical protein